MILTLVYDNTTDIFTCDECIITLKGTLRMMRGSDWIDTSIDIHDTSLIEIFVNGEAYLDIYTMLYYELKDLEENDVFSNVDWEDFE